MPNGTKTQAHTESADDSRAATDNITAGLKRDIDRCIRADRRLKPSEKIIAEAIVDFMNAKTGATFPSDQALADRTGLSVDVAKRSRGNLKKTGWLDWDFVPGHTNTYRVLTGNLKAIEAERAALDEARKQARNRPAGEATNDPTSGVHAPPPRASTPHPPGRTRPTNPLKEPTERTHGEGISSPSQSDFSANDKTAGKEQTQPGASPRASSKKASSAPSPEQASSAPPPKRKRWGPARFAEFWAAYPRKYDQKAAEAAYTRAVRNGIATEEELVTGAMLFAAERASENPKYTKYATTWLKGECWKNPNAPKSPGNGFNGSSSGPRRSYNDSIFAGLAEAVRTQQ